MLKDSFWSHRPANGSLLSHCQSLNIIVHFTWNRCGWHIWVKTPDKSLLHVKPPAPLVCHANVGWLCVTAIRLRAARSAPCPRRREGEQQTASVSASDWCCWCYCKHAQNQAEQQMSQCVMEFDLRGLPQGIIWEDADAKLLWSRAVSAVERRNPRDFLSLTQQ